MKKQDAKIAAAQMAAQAKAYATREGYVDSEVLFWSTAFGYLTGDLAAAYEALEPSRPPEWIENDSDAREYSDIPMFLRKQAD